MILEACVEGYGQAIRTDNFFEVKRVELCENLGVGGVTPSYGTIKVVRKNLSETKLFVIIRPRGGDFVYSKKEIEIMKEEIGICKTIGVDGVVIGALIKEKNEFRVDVDVVSELVRLSKPEMEVTFHMAFDELEKPFEAIDSLIRLGVNRILTKGGKDGPAIKNWKSLKAYVEHADGRITIMPGGGVTHTNVRELKELTNAKEFHGTRIVDFSDK